MYPNNLLLTRLTMLNPRRRLQGFGKLLPTVTPENYRNEVIGDRAKDEDMGRIKEEKAKR